MERHNPQRSAGYASTTIFWRSAHHVRLFQEREKASDFKLRKQRRCKSQRAGDDAAHSTSFFQLRPLLFVEDCRSQRSRVAASLGSLVAPDTVLLQRNTRTATTAYKMTATTATTPPMMNLAFF